MHCGGNLYILVISGTTGRDHEPKNIGRATLCDDTVFDSPFRLITLQ